MDKTNKKTLEEIIRVDHAGERGAIKIYEGQLLALKTFKQNASLKKKIEEMKEHEKEHYEYFEGEVSMAHWYFNGSLLASLPPVISSSSISSSINASPLSVDIP